MKKTSLVGIVLVVGAYAIGYKSRDFIRDNIYLPLRTSINQKKLEAETSYQQVLCPKDGITLATFGQSNSANYVRPKASISIPKNIFKYDWISGKCYEYKEPLIGTDGEGGNIITYTAVRLASTTSKPITIVPFGVGGTSVLQWAYGYLSYQQDIALSNMKRDGIKPQIFLWHQGEGDARRDGLNPKDLLVKEKKYFWFNNIRTTNYSPLGLQRVSYSNALQTVLDRTRRIFPESYFGIALVSRCDGRGQWEPIRAAQREIAERNKNSFISADSDKIYNDRFRYDKCHFSKEGAQELGNQYYSSVSTLLK